MIRIAVPSLLLSGLALAWHIASGDAPGAGAATPHVGRAEPPTPQVAAPVEPNASDASDDGARRALDPTRTTRDPGEPIEALGPTETVTVHVRLQRGLDRSAPPVPSLGFQVGVAFGDKGWEGPVDGDKHVLVEGTADEDGRATLELAIPTRLLDAAGEVRRVVWGAVTSDGWRQRVNWRSLPDPGEDAVELALLARTGGTIYGKVLRTDGEPAFPGEVFLCTRASDEGPVELEDSEPLLPGGTFALHYEEPGEYALHATAPGAGAVTLEGLRLTREPPAHVELTLEGAGFLAGRVLGPGGAPHANYPLWVFPEWKRDTYVGYFSDPVKVHQQWSGGLTDDYVVTDEDGRFRFDGLRAGRYLIRGFTPQSGYYAELLTDETVPTDTDGLTLTAPGYRLLLHVNGADGKPLAGLDLAHRPTEELSAPHALYCEESDARGRLLAPERYMHERRTRLANGAVVLDVEPGKSYVVGVVSRTHALHEELIHVPDDRPLGEHTIDLAPAGAQAGLVVHVLTPDGLPFEETNQVKVYSPASGRLLVETSRYRDESEYRVALGAGRYRVVVSAEPMRGHHGERFSDTPHRPTERLVEIFAGQENAFDVHLGSGGRLALELACDAALEPPELDEARREELGWNESFRLLNHGAEVRLEPVDGGDPTRPYFDLGFPFELEGDLLPWGTVEETWIPVGRDATTVTPIRPGAYTLVVSPPGFRELRRPVEIRADETTKVKVKVAADDRVE
jgi:hypothetical protein